MQYIQGGEYSTKQKLKLENGRSTPGCLTVQSAINTTVSTKKTRRTLMK